MALQVRTKASGRISKLIALPMLLLALVAQPMYGLVSEQVAGAINSNGALNQNPDLKINFPREGASVSSRGDKIEIKGVFKDDIKANYANFQLVGAGVSKGVGIIYGYGSVFNPAATYADESGNYTYNLPVDASLPSGDYSIFYTGTDFTGGVTERMERKIFIDNDTPSTSLVVEGLSEGVVGGTFRVSGQATDNRSLSRVYVQLVDRQTGGRVGGTTIHLSGTSQSWSKVYSGLPDGRYAVHVSVTDTVGNTDNVGWTDDFVVDSIAPVAVAESSINGKVLQTVNGKEVTFSSADESGLRRFDVTLWRDGTRVPGASPIFSAGGAVPAGQRESFTTTFALPSKLDLPEGSYSLYTTATDLAGNSRDGNTIRFTIDQTPPEVFIVSAPKGTVNGSPSFKWSENVKVEVKDDNLGKTELFRAGETEAIQTHEGAVFNLDKDRSLQGRFYLVHTDGANNKSEPVYFELHQLGPKVTDVQGVGADGVTVMSENGNTKISFNVSKNGGTDIVHVEVRAKQGAEWSGKDILALKDESGEEGRYEFDLTGIVSGNHGKTYIVQVQVKNAAGEHATHQYIIKVDNETTTPTINSVVGSGTTRVVSGIAEPGVTVFVTVGGVTKETLVDESGEWSVRFENITPGQRTAHAFAEDTLGNRSEEVTSRFMVVVALVETPQVNEPVELMSPLPAGGNSSPAAAASPFVSFFTLPGEEAAGAQTEASDDDASDVLGAQTGEEGEASTGAVVSEGWKIFGLMWYWWLLILAMLAGIWWIIAAARRRKEDEATA